MCSQAESKTRFSIVRSCITIWDIVRAILKNRFVLYVISVVCFLYVWDYIAVHRVFGSYMPRLVEVIAMMGSMMAEPLATKTLLEHVWASLSRVLIGFLLAVVTGVALGLFMALNRHVNAFVRPVFDLLKPMPPIAWISLSILWFGIGETSKVFIIWVGAVVPCVINAYNGIRLIDPELYDVVRMLGGKPRDEAVEVVMPAAFPAIFAGIQISLSSAWACVVAAELVAARSGIGFIINLGMNLSEPSMIVGGMAVIAVIAWFLAVSVEWLERWICPWKRELL